MFKKDQKWLTISLMINLVFIILALIFVARRGGVNYLVKKLSFVNPIRQEESRQNQKQYRQHTYRTSYNSMKTKIFRQLPNAKNEIIFLGDSLTDQGEWGEMFKNSNILNRGISGDTTEGILDRLDEVVESQPTKIFLLIGTNDFWNEGQTIDEVLQKYKIILTEIKNKSPKTKVYVQSLLPVNSIEYNPKLDTETLADFNPHLRKLAAEFSYEYIDLYPHFLDQQKQLNSKYTTDGVHLNGEGYLLWQNLITKYVNN